jgi:hypothetical protein
VALARLPEGLGIIQRKWLALARRRH